MYRLELPVYFVAFVASLLYSLYRFYKVSLDNFHQYDSEDFRFDCRIRWLCSTPQDVTDLEWQVAKRFFLDTKATYLVTHLIGFYLAKKLFPKHLSTFIILFSSLTIYNLLSLSVLILVYVNIITILVLEYSLRHFRFAFKQLIPYALFMTTVAVIHKIDAHEDREKKLLIQVAFSWLNAKCLSSTVDRQGAMPASFKTHLAYLFYFPAFFFGPIYHYSDFATMMCQLEQRDQIFRFRFRAIFNLIRYLFWAQFLEVATHFIYSSSLQYYTFVTETFDAWSLCGFGFALTIMFYLKYVVIYGITRAVAEIDGFENVIAQPPECIAHMHKTSYLWRKFDQGLYFFLMKYFYKPLTGAHHTDPLRKIFAGFVCFTVIGIWHGYYDAVITWVSINIILSYSEIAGFVIRDSPLFITLTSKISADNRARFEALVGAPYLMIAYLSNVFFLSNYENGILLWNKVATRFPIPLLPTLLIFYCGCHVCRHINQKIKECK